MSQEDLDALKNASVIIERFGGIRPMAAKVGAPVTTVQGWKKRDVIPGTRRDDVVRLQQDVVFRRALQPAGVPDVFDDLAAALDDHPAAGIFAVAARPRDRL